MKSAKNGLSDKTVVRGGETLFIIKCATIFSKFKNSIVLCTPANDARTDSVQFSFYKSMVLFRCRIVLSISVDEELERMNQGLPWIKKLHSWMSKIEVYISI